MLPTGGWSRQRKQSPVDSAPEDTTSGSLSARQELSNCATCSCQKACWIPPSPGAAPASGCWEPVVEFEPTTRCLSGSGSAWVKCPLLCAGVHTRRCLHVFVSSVVPRIVSRHPLWLSSWLSNIEKGHSSIEEWPLQVPMDSGFVLVSPVGLEPTTR